MRVLLAVPKTDYGRPGADDMINQPAASSHRQRPIHMPDLAADVFVLDSQPIASLREHRVWALFDECGQVHDLGGDLLAVQAQSDKLGGYTGRVEAQRPTRRAHRGGLGEACFDSGQQRRDAPGGGQSPHVTFQLCHGCGQPPWQIDARTVVEASASTALRSPARSPECASRRPPTTSPHTPSGLASSGAGL